MGKKYILFGAAHATQNPNKGFDLLLSSLKYIRNSKNVEILLFGNDRNENIHIKSNFKINSFGKIFDDSFLNLLYSAADVTVVPSRSENFPNTILESFSSGTPVVAFSIGGIPEIIDHLVNGYLVTPFDVKDLAKGIDYCLTKKNLSNQTREKVLLKFRLNKQANSYLELYGR